MSEVKRVPEDSGIKDGVELASKCFLTIFKNGGNPSGEAMDCNIVASWSESVLSIGFNNKKNREVVSVRIDELLRVLKEAADLKVAKEKSDGQENNGDT